MKRKILFYISNLTCGGAERVVCNLANHFCGLGYEIIVLTDRKDEEEFILNDQVKRTVLPIREGDGRLKDAVGRIQDIRSVFTRECPDIIISFANKCNLKALLAGLFIKIPVVPSVRSDPNREYGRKWKGLFAKLLFLSADSVIFQTEQARQYFFKKNRDHSVILLNPINKKFMKPLYGNTRKNEIVSAGSLREVKNHEMLIRAFAKISSQIPDYILTIYGEGELRDHLLNVAEECGVGSKFFLPGICDELENKMASSRLFVLSSNTEGMPNALMEAMSLGLAVISTDCPCGGPAQLIRNGENGFLVPVGDVEALAEKMLLVLSDRELENKLHEQAHLIQKKYNSENVLEEWRIFIETVVKKQKG